MPGPAHGITPADRAEGERAAPRGRHVTLDGSVNFRDLGGYGTTDGRRLRWGRLFRADGLHRLTERDLEVLAGLGLHTVVDLRTVEEGERRGRFPTHAVPVRYFDIPMTDVLPGLDDLASWQEAAHIADEYVRMVTDGAAAVARAFGALAGPAALPAVFHCSAGKDRTGVLAALLLAFLGVPDEVIVEDYVLSARAMESLIARLKEEYPDSPDAIDRYAPAVLHVPAGAMEGFLATIRRQHGSYRAFAGSLGVADEVAVLATELLEPA